MAKQKAELTDPVETGANAEKERAELGALDIKTAKKGGLSFKPIPPDRARITRPFDGYPLRKLEIGEIKTSPTFIIALNPTVPVFQDPSNRSVKTKAGMEKIQTHHSRVIRDRETKENTIVVFDRIIEADGREFQCAIVPSHNVRAQICFLYNPQKNRIEVDRRYLLLDSEQDSRLKRVFEQVINPKLNMERDAAFISGESTEDKGEAEPVQE